nr:hypothetical protein Iba_chr15aCG6680 [Ipomoea batatas]
MVTEVAFQCHIQLLVMNICCLLRFTTIEFFDTWITLLISCIQLKMMNILLPIDFPKEQQD